METPAVFKAMNKRDNPPLTEMPEVFGNLSSLIAYLEVARNDMQTAAEEICPAVTEVMTMLKAERSCLFARMSGSGATCYALCDPGQEQDLASNLRARRPDWWVAAGRL